MKKILGIILVCAMVIITGVSAFAYKETDKLVNTQIYVKKNGDVELKLKKIDYQLSQVDAEFRSSEKSDWQIVVLNKIGKQIVQGYLNFKDMRTVIGQNATKSSLGNKSNTKDNEYSKMSYFIFKSTPKTYKVELFYKKELKASTLVSEAK
ncbi:MAG: hypothetical protein ACXVAX_05635 [Pseudobdellovibrio sp.]